MPNRFRISKLTGDEPHYSPDYPWLVEYPDRYTEEPNDGAEVESFAAAIEHFIWAADRQCPMCGRGQVRDTEWGWECRAYGSYDVASGCKHPSEVQAHVS